MGGWRLASGRFVRQWPNWCCECLCHTSPSLLVPVCRLGVPQTPRGPPPNNQVRASAGFGCDAAKHVTVVRWWDPRRGNEESGVGGWMPALQTHRPTHAPSSILARICRRVNLLRWRSDKTRVASRSRMPAQELFPLATNVTRIFSGLCVPVPSRHGNPHVQQAIGSVRREGGWDGNGLGVPPVCVRTSVVWCRLGS